MKDDAIVYKMENQITSFGFMLEVAGVWSEKEWMVRERKCNSGMG